MKTHTPGPWVLNDARSTRVDLINTQRGHAVGEIVWVDVRNPADARLIAAAPELLRALEMIEQAASGHVPILNSWAWRVAHAAIVRATGGQQ